MQRQLLAGVGVIAGLFVAVQLVPYGRAHANPPVRTEPRWDSPQTRALAVRACFDCHSNQTSWPWYSSIAPVSWLVQRDVDEGRRALNLSEMDLPQREARGASRNVQRGEMPPGSYVLTHPGAGLTPDERQALVSGLAATLGTRSVARGDAGEGRERTR